MTPIILYQNAIVNASITAETASGDYNKDYLKDYKPFTYWKGASETSNEIIIDLLTDTFIGAIALISHNLSEISGKISIYKSSDAVDYELIGSEITVTNKNVMLKLLSGESGGTSMEFLQGGSIGLLQGGNLEALQSESYTARFWKIEITSSAAPVIASIFMGEFIQFEHPAITPTVPQREKIIAKTSTSNGGDDLSRDVRYYSRSANYRFVDLSRSFWQSNLEPFWEYAKQLKEFVIAWDNTNRPKDVFYCRLDETFEMKESLTMLEYEDELDLQLKILA